MNDHWCWKKEGAASRSSAAGGQSLAEFAIVLPILLALVIGIVEFANAWRTSQIVTNATREGARIGVLPDSRGDDENKIAAYIENYLDESGLDGSAATITVECDDGSGYSPGACSSSGHAEKINVQYDYTFVFLGPVIDFMTGGGGSQYGTITLDATTTMRNE